MGGTVDDINLARARSRVAQLPPHVGNPLMGFLDDVEELTRQLGRLKYSLEGELASAQLKAAYERFDRQAAASEAVELDR